MKQGEVLSPLLFNLFDDDMRDIFDETCQGTLSAYRIHWNKPMGAYCNEYGISHLPYALGLVLMSTSECGLSKLKESYHTRQLEVIFKRARLLPLTHLTVCCVDQDLVFKGSQWNL